MLGQVSSLLNPQTASNLIQSTKPTVTNAPQKDRVSIGEPREDGFLKKAGKFMLDMGRMSVLAAAPAVAGWLGGPWGVVGAVAGSTIYGAIMGDGAKACALYGLLAGMGGAVFGPFGVGVMAYLGAAGCAVKHFVRRMEP